MFYKQTQTMIWGRRKQKGLRPIGKQPQQQGRGIVRRRDWVACFMACLIVVCWVTLLHQFHSVVQQKERQPHLFLHVGPHKMSTSALQIFLVQQQDKVLATDNITVIDHLAGPLDAGGGAKNAANLALCWKTSLTVRERAMAPNLETCRTEILPQFRRLLRQARLSGRDVILSSEELSVRINLKELASEIGGFELHVIVFYRRYYDFLLSLHNQLNKQGPVENRMTIVEWMERQEYKAFQHSYEVYRAYQSFFPNAKFSLVNMENKSKSPLTRFLCEILKAPRTCDYWTRTGAETARVNERQHLEGGFVLKYALLQDDVLKNKKQLQQKSSKASQVEANVNRYLQTHPNADLPLICLKDDQLRELLQLSIEYEKQLFPDWHDEVALREDFARKQDQFCTINAEVFLRQLNPQTRDAMLLQNDI